MNAVTGDLAHELRDYLVEISPQLLLLVSRVGCLLLWSIYGPSLVTRFVRPEHTIEVLLAGFVWLGWCAMWDGIRIVVPFLIEARTSLEDRVWPR